MVGYPNLLDMSLALLKILPMRLEIFSHNWASTFSRHFLELSPNLIQIRVSCKLVSYKTRPDSRPADAVIAFAAVRLIQGYH